MVTVRISDGLGNQMFQYACALAVAKGNWKEIVLDTSEVDNLGVRQYSLDLYKVRYKKRFSWSNKSIWKKVIKKLKYIIYYKRIKEKNRFIMINQYLTNGLPECIYMGIGRAINTLNNIQMY